jgi:hypothetical protein
MTSLVAEGERRVAQSMVLVDITPRIERGGSERIRAFMTSAPSGFGSLEEVAAAVHAYNPYRPRPSDLDGLTKNVRQSDDGRWYWHWDPRFMRIGDEPGRAERSERLYSAARCQQRLKIGSDSISVISHEWSSGLEQDSLS